MLRSLEGQKGLKEVIIVNLKPGELFDVDMPRGVDCRVIDFPNRGYGASCNAGLALATSEIVAVSNADVEFKPGAFERALEHFDKYEDTGILAPSLYFPDGSWQPSGRRFYTWEIILWARSPLRAVLGDPPSYEEHLMSKEDTDVLREVDWAVGAMLFVRRKALTQADKIFDPRYFLYFEDVDLCWEMWKRGWKVIQDPDIKVTHHYERASRRVFSRFAIHHAASLCKFLLKHRGLVGRLP